MSVWDGNNFYYSGQGVMLVGKRTALGKPQGLIPVGNVSSLKIAIATTTLTHKESQSGARLTDLRIATETNGTLTAVMENINSVNLKLALLADRTDHLGGSVTDEAISGYLGAAYPLKFARVTVTNVKRGATTLTLYTNDATPWDYKKNEAAGSLFFNDGLGSALVGAITTGGTDVTAITLTNPTRLTVAVPSQTVVGDKMVVTGAAGADAALLNGKAFEILAIIGSPGTAVDINLDTTGKTITVAGTEPTFFDGNALTCTYTFAAQKILDTLTQPIQERWIRFEGLNTADGNNPVIIDVFKAQFSAASEVDLISDALQNLSLEGTLLSDPLQVTGSKWFKETLIR